MNFFIKLLPKIPAFFRTVITVANAALETFHVIVGAVKGIRAVFAAATAA